FHDGGGVGQEAGRPVPYSYGRKPNGTSQTADAAIADRLELRPADRGGEDAAVPAVGIRRRMEPGRSGASMLRRSRRGVGDAGPSDRPGRQEPGRLYGRRP